MERSGVSAGRPGGPRGFTLVELLVVIAVIVLLLSVLTVAIAAATRSSHNANTRALLGSVRQALARFREDVGYYPPVLGPQDPDASLPAGEQDQLRSLKRPPAPASYASEVQTWFSYTTVPDYLIGYGNHRQDGYGVVDPTDPGDVWTEERPPLGIRHPQSDGVWGASMNGGGLLSDRMGGTNPNIDTGRVLGPYLELKDERLLASTDGTYTSTSSGPRLNVYLAGEGGFDPDHPRVLVDYWGSPIRYYRQVYPQGALHLADRSFDPNGPNVPPDYPTLADVFLLRPVNVPQGSETDGIADANGDTTSSFALRSAEFALFSPGPDRKLDASVRYDAAGLNRDNIVEAGP
jgi:prepilin-type N-terminal cleavage/methylation domain-containing protein